MFTIFSDENGKLYEDPALGFLGRTGDVWKEPEDFELIEMPQGASLVMMPERYPVGWDVDQRKPVCLERAGAKRAVVLAALLPQGFTRTYLPAGVKPQGAKNLPLYGYTAVAGDGHKIYLCAVQTDEHRKWHPRYYNTKDLEALISERLALHPANRILKQLAHCSLHYSCFTAQNIFYRRWEGGIPTSPKCNANCIGCISKNHPGWQAPQNRISFLPDEREIVEVAVFHLEEAEEGIISFGQGCEGEPALRADCLSKAVKAIRGRTSRGCININTNAGYFEGIKMMVDAGLDCMRVTMLSASKEDYYRYHRPGYDFGEIEKSIKYGVDNGVFVSLNLLTMPGYTDGEDQIERLLELKKMTGFQMVQLRNLNIDPDYFYGHFVSRSRALGIIKMIEIFKDHGIEVGSYTHPRTRARHC